MLTAYAKRYLGGDAAGWAEWIGGMGDFATIESAKARKMFDQLKLQAKPSWRLEQLEGRLIMAEANTAVASRKTWDKKRLDAARRYWQTKEHLFRNVWRFGLLRHIFRFENEGPAWNQEYQQVTGKKHNSRILKIPKEA